MHVSVMIHIIIKCTQSCDNENYNTQFIRFLVTCFSEVATSSSDENVDETDESSKQKKDR